MVCSERRIAIAERSRASCCSGFSRAQALEFALKILAATSASTHVVYQRDSTLLGLTVITVTYWHSLAQTIQGPRVWVENLEQHTLSCSAFRRISAKQVQENQRLWQATDAVPQTHRQDAAHILENLLPRAPNSDEMQGPDVRVDQAP